MGIAADADLTLCTAGRGADEKALCYSGEGSTGEALECLVLAGEAESDCTGALLEVVVPGSVTKSLHHLRDRAQAGVWTPGPACGAHHIAMEPVIRACVGASRVQRGTSLAVGTANRLSFPCRWAKGAHGHGEAVEHSCP